MLILVFPESSAFYGLPIRLNCSSTILRDRRELIPTSAMEAMVDCNIIRIIDRSVLGAPHRENLAETNSQVAYLLSPMKDNQCCNYALSELDALVCLSGDSKVQIVSNQQIL